MSLGLMVTDKFIYQMEVDLWASFHMASHMDRAFIMLKMGR